jgi:hypothetical protein
LADFQPKVKAKPVTEKQLIGEYQKISGKQAMCVLQEMSGGVTVFLLAIAKDEKSCKDNGNGDFYIQYEQSFMMGRSKKESRSVICAHFIPGQNNRYLVKTRTGSISHYSDNNYIGDTEPREEWNEWEEQGYADESTEYKNLLEYYRSHKSEIPVLKMNTFKQ